MFYVIGIERDNCIYYGGGEAGMEFFYLFS